MAASCQPFLADIELVAILARALNLTKAEIRSDRGRYAALHEDDSQYERGATWIDWTTLAVVVDEGDDDDDSTFASMYGRTDFDVGRTRFTIESPQVARSTDRSLRRLLAEQDGELYGAQVRELVASGRLDPDLFEEVRCTGRIQARSDGLIDTARALFLLDNFPAKRLSEEDEDLYEVEPEWVATLERFKPSSLAHHLGFFFQTPDMARCTGALFEGAEADSIEGGRYEPVASWGVGEGQGSFHLARIVEDTVAPVPAYEGSVLIRKRTDAATWPSLAELRRSPLADVLRPHAAKRVTFAAIATVGELAEQGPDVYFRGLRAKKKAQRVENFTVVINTTKVLGDARAHDAALRLCDAALAHAPAELAAPILFNQGVNLMKMGHFAEALAADLECLAKLPVAEDWAHVVPASHLHNNIAWCAYKVGDLELAATHSALAIEDGPDNMDAVSTAGVIAFVRGDETSAFAQLETSMKQGVDPEPPPSLLAHPTFRALALKYGIPVALTDEEVTALGPDGCIDDDLPDEDDDDEEDDDDDE